MTASIGDICSWISYLYSAIKIGIALLTREYKTFLTEEIIGEILLTVY